MKCESTFSHHKRQIANRSRAGGAVIGAQITVRDDPRLSGPLQNIDLSNFELLEAHMVHSGDSELQARKVKDIAAKYSHPAV